MMISVFWPVSLSMFWLVQPLVTQPLLAAETRPIPLRLFSPPHPDLLYFNIFQAGLRLSSSMKPPFICPVDSMLFPPFNFQ